jgi:predicted RNase H-like HicB family nuclease
VKVTARTHREGEYWAIEIPEVPGAFTQARSLEEVPAMAREAVRLLVMGHDNETIEVTVAQR